jgi:hypothetical protein
MRVGGWGRIPVGRKMSRHPIELLRRDAMRFRGGLVIKARRIFVSLIARPRITKREIPHTRTTSGP